MFERFTDQARRAVVLAQEEARLLEHNYIGTEHILLGLIHEGDGVACQALESFGVSLGAVREGVEKAIGRGQVPPSGHIPFTPRAKRVLDLALREANQLGQRYIGTEHLLLGLLREGEGVACQVLVQVGADLNRVRQQVINLLSGYAAAGGEAAAFESVSVHVETAEHHPDPALFPLCRRCGRSLDGNMTFRVMRAQQAEGEGVRNALVLYCGTCGTVVEGSILPEEA